MNLLTLSNINFYLVNEVPVLARHKESVGGLVVCDTVQHVVGPVVVAPSYAFFRDVVFLIGDQLSKIESFFDFAIEVDHDDIVLLENVGVNLSVHIFQLVDALDRLAVLGHWQR